MAETFCRMDSETLRLYNGEGGEKVGRKLRNLLENIFHVFACNFA